jgi:hypothetical protein
VLSFTAPSVQSPSRSIITSSASSAPLCKRKQLPALQCYPEQSDYVTSRLQPTQTDITVAQTPNPSIVHSEAQVVRPVTQLPLSPSVDSSSPGAEKSVTASGPSVRPEALPFFDYSGTGDPYFLVSLITIYIFSQIVACYTVTHHPRAPHDWANHVHMEPGRLGCRIGYS